MITCVARVGGQWRVGVLRPADVCLLIDDLRDPRIPPSTVITQRPSGPSVIDGILKRKFCTCLDIKKTIGFWCSSRKRHCYSEMGFCRRVTFEASGESAEQTAKRKRRPLKCFATCYYSFIPSLIRSFFLSFIKFSQPKMSPIPLIISVTISTLQINSLSGLVLALFTALETTRVISRRC